MHGADKVSINSAAVKNPKLIKEAAKNLEVNAL
jgi:imidazole glycerol phosphate synthase subunit HisF